VPVVKQQVGTEDVSALTEKLQILETQLRREKEKSTKLEQNLTQKSEGEEDEKSPCKQQ